MVDFILHFPDIAGPVVGLHASQGLVIDSINFFPQVLHSLIQQGLCQYRDIDDAITQRRHFNNHWRQPVIEVLAKSP